MDNFKTKLKLLNFDDLVDYLIEISVLNHATYQEFHDLVALKQPHDVEYDFIISHSTTTQLEKIKKNFDIDLGRTWDANLHASNVRGNFPNFPPNYVNRPEVVSFLKSQIKKITWRRKILIYGMVGLGKSCLLNETLQDVALLKRFDYCVFWVNLAGQVFENCLGLMWNLYNEVIELTTLPRFAHCPDSTSRLKTKLNEIFLTLKNPLIVLDNASDSKLLSEFDFKFNIVITSQNRSILTNQDIQQIEFKYRFTTQETCILFESEFATLPNFEHQVARMSHACKGHPMLLNLIFVYLRDMRDLVLMDSAARWSEVVDMLEQGDYSFNRVDDEAANITKAVKLCVEQLPKNLRHFYQQLVIFKKDVNIVPQVLSRLYKKSDLEVAAIMQHFVDRSLVVSFFNRQLRSYVYSLHDIFHNFLRSTVGGATCIEFHRDLLAGYGNEFARLEDDNYTLQYIGFHLFEAKQFDWFAKLFCDFAFLERKIKAAGPQDLLFDLEHYGGEVRSEDFQLKKLPDLIRFVDTFGSDLYRYDGTTLVQFALQFDANSWLYREGKLLASKSEGKKMFFEVQPARSNSNDIIDTETGDEVTVVCFVDSNYVLYGDVTGDIKMFHPKHHKVSFVYKCHMGAVVQLEVNRGRTHFLSVGGADHLVVLWRIMRDSKRRSSDFGYFVDTPSNKQPTYHHLHPLTTPHHDYLSTFEVENDNLLSATFNSDSSINRIVGGTENGNVIVWDLSTSAAIASSGARGAPATNLNFLRNFVLFQCDAKIQIVVIQDGDDQLTLWQTIDCSAPILQLYLIPSSTLVVIHPNKVVTIESEVNFFKKLIEIESFDLKNEQVMRSAMMHDYLVVSTKSENVKIINLKTKSLICQLNKWGLARSLDVFFDECSATYMVLLAGAEGGRLVRCHVDGGAISNFVFATKMRTNQRPLAAVYTGSSHEIEIFQGHKLISVAEVQNGGKGDCSAICFSDCGDLLYYVCGGKICEFDLKKRSTRQFEFAADLRSLQFMEREAILVATGSDDDSSLMAVKEAAILDVQKVGAFRVFSTEVGFLVVDLAGNIFRWEVEGKRLRHLFVLRDHEMAAAAHCRERALVAIASMKLEVFNVDVFGYGGGEVKLVMRWKVGERVTELGFGGDRFLGVGCVKGGLMVYDLKTAETRHFNLHTSAITQLIFNYPYLVAVGGSISFWDVEGATLKAHVKLPHDIKRAVPFNNDVMTQFQIVDSTANIYTISLIGRNSNNTTANWKY